ncbi:MAG: Daunorubicin/doxorubicin resistance ATP-binding protein DrrA [Firmicutes bacterium ADurb.Bin182]|nr:MAG: Daunorubicin/doxorubicin resistance ATP-binding protein DrrA [Firmicutes bacterium ADurb.Bin182]
MDKIIEVKGLKKSYGSVQAVRGIDFYVERGKLFAFLGPNGAGKSTTIDIISTLLKPDEGSVTVDSLILGRDDVKIREKVGTMFQDSLLDDELTVRENLRVRGSFYGMSKAKLESAVDEAAKAAGLEGFLDRRYGKLSGGQRRRTDIARALLNAPDILILDEPTTGLDPQTRKSIWDTIRLLQTKNGMTVFLTTHYMEEADNADFVVVIDDGLIAAKGTPSELKERYTSDILKITPKQNDALAELLNEMGLDYFSAGGAVHIKIQSSFDALPVIERCKDLISSFEVHSGTMDDAFIGITGKEIRE